MTGELPEGAALVEALAAVGSGSPRWVTVGPATARLGRSVLIAPVSGVDDLAHAVVEASAAFGRPVQERPVLGHLTLARGRGGCAVPEHLAGQAVEAAWMVQEVHLVRGHLGAHGARYETIATIPLHPEKRPTP